MRNLCLSLIACGATTAFACLIAIRAVGYALPLPWEDIQYSMVSGAGIGAVGALPVCIVSLLIHPKNQYKAIGIGAAVVALVGGLYSYCAWAAAASC